MNHPPLTGPELDDLFAWFPPADDLPTHEILPAEAIPEPFHSLLCHKHHMTVTVEDYHGDTVDVHPLVVQQRGPFYARKIILTLRESARVALFGIVRVNLDFTSAPVRAAILERKLPFGRILIQHNVMRRIEPTAYLKIEPGPLQLAWFKLTERQPLYGRLAYIHCDGHPAVELFEVVAG